MGDTPNNTYFGIVAPGEILTRLHDALEVTGDGWPLLMDAADEIERLRHQVDDLRRCLEDTQFQIERLRAAGNALAKHATHERGCFLPGLEQCWCGASAASARWQEARQ